MNNFKCTHTHPLTTLKYRFNDGHWEFRGIRYDYDLNVDYLCWIKSGLRSGFVALPAEELIPKPDKLIDAVINLFGVAMTAIVERLEDDEDIYFANTQWYLYAVEHAGVVLDISTYPEAVKSALAQIEQVLKRT